MTDEHKLYDNLYNLLITTDEPNQKAVILQSFVQFFGPVENEYSEKIRSAMMASDERQREKQRFGVVYCPKCGKESIKYVDHCSFCGYQCGGRARYSLISSDDIVVWRSRCFQTVPREIACDMFDEVKNNILKRTAIEIAERLIRENMIEVKQKTKVDHRTNCIEIEIESKIRLFDKNYEVDYHDR